MKSELLVIGCGGCGNNLIDTFMGLDPRYTGIFANTNMAEMETLENFDIERRCFYIPNADGTGKERKLAEKYIKTEFPKFVEQIVKFTNQKYVIFMASLDGGTGSKSITMLSRLAKRYCPEKSINIIATFPTMNEGQKSYENTIETWNELMDLKKKGIIDSFQFIDNNKCDERQINRVTMEELDDSFNIVGGKIDSSDLEKAQISKGYKVFLKLDGNVKDTDYAIDKAIKNSFYYMPDNFECDVLLGSINVNSHNIRKIKEKFKAFDITKFSEVEEGDSFIILGGCEMPTEPIQLIDECLSDIKKRKEERVVQNDLVVKTERKEKEVAVSREAKTSSKLSSKDLKAMQNDDSFWD